MFAARERAATAISESLSQIIKRCFPMIVGMSAQTASEMSEPIFELIETEIQKLIHGMSIVVIEGFARAEDDDCACVCVCACDCPAA